MLSEQKEGLMQRRLMGLPLAIATGFLSLLVHGCSGGHQDVVPPQPLPNKTVTLGPQQTLLPDGSFGLEAFPDEAVAVIQRVPTWKMLVASGISTYLLEGTSLLNITSARLVLWPGDPGSFDNGYAGSAGAYLHTGGKLYMIYHGEDQEGMPPLAGGTGIPGFYASVGLAVSSDNGDTWEKLGPVITSNKPKEWTYYEGQDSRGAGVPSLVKEKTGRYLYLYYTEFSRVGGRGVQVCLARCDIQQNAPTPGTWKKYYAGDFGEPGIAGLDTVVMSALDMNQGEAMMAHVVYSNLLQKYVMVFNIDCWRELSNNGTPQTTGMYISYSTDGIVWSKPEALFIDYCIAQMGKSLSWEPTIIWDDDTDQTGWLVYGYTEHWGYHYNNSGNTHYMVGRRISFTTPAS